MRALLASALATLVAPLVALGSFSSWTSGMPAVEALGDEPGGAAKLSFLLACLRANLSLLLDPVRYAWATAPIVALLALAWHLRRTRSSALPAALIVGLTVTAYGLSVAWYETLFHCGQEYSEDAIAVAGVLTPIAAFLAATMILFLWPRRE